MTLKQYLDEGETYLDKGSFDHPVYLVNLSKNKLLITLKRKYFNQSGRPTRSGNGEDPGLSLLPDALTRRGNVQEEEK